eukprot:9471510-Pyramimonas_sp.AAC.1
MTLVRAGLSVLYPYDSAGRPTVAGLGALLVHMALAVAFGALLFLPPSAEPSAAEASGVSSEQSSEQPPASSAGAAAATGPAVWPGVAPSSVELEVESKETALGEKYVLVTPQGAPAQGTESGTNDNKSITRILIH